MAHGSRLGRSDKQKRALGSTLFCIGAGDRTCKETLRGDGIASKASVPISDYSRHSHARGAAKP